MIRVGITEMHGIAKEICQNAWDDVKYVPLRPLKHFSDGIITSSVSLQFCAVTGRKGQKA